MKTSQTGLDLIRKWEGFRDHMYLDSIGKQTTGIGTLIDTPAEQYLKTTKITEEQAFSLLRNDVVKFENVINTDLKVKLTQNQFDALVCFTYNVGPGNFTSSTLLKKINIGDYKGAALEFLKWDKANGKSLPGLTMRRKDEMNLFNKI